jgi:hypothetical protein
LSIWKIFYKIWKRAGAPSLKGRRFGWLIPEGGEDPSLARGFEEE